MPLCVSIITFMQKMKNWFRNWEGLLRALAESMYTYPPLLSKNSRNILRSRVLPDGAVEIYDRMCEQEGHAFFGDDRRGSQLRVKLRKECRKRL